MKRLLALALALALTLSFVSGGTGAAAEQFTGPTTDAFLNVLKSNAPFYMKELVTQGLEKNDKHILLRDLLKEDGFTREIEQFTVFDMDGDGGPEVLIELSGTGDRVVFHYEKGEMYGFLVSFRGMKTLKTDGSFDGSGGADDSSISKLQFKDGTADYAELARNPADDVWDKQDKKEDVEWYPYAKDTFDADFGTAWKNRPTKR